MQFQRGVAQSGSALGWGPSGRRFKSCLPDSLAVRRLGWYNKDMEGTPRTEQELREQAANAWDVYGRKPISEDEIRRETERLQG